LFLGWVYGNKLELMKKNIQKEELEDNINNDIKHGFILIICVIALWVLLGFLPFYGIDNWTERAQLGDMFGVINSLFSGLAFAGVIYTIILQRKELSLQRKELKDTRTVFQEQSSLMKLQQKVNVFFQMLENHRGIIKSLNTNDSISSFSRQGTNTLIQLEGHEVIEKIINNSIKGLKILNKLIVQRRGKAIDYHFYNHSSMLKEIYELDNIANSILFIINFIYEQLNNDDVYHKIFYNALSKNEKAIFGIYFNFINPSARKQIDKSNFDYFEEYISRGFEKIDILDKIEVPYFQTNLTSNRFPNSEEMEMGNFPKLVLNNLSASNTKVISIACTSGQNVLENMNQITYNLDLPFHQPIEFSLAPYLLDLLNKDENIMKIMKKDLTKYEINLEIVLNHNETKYIASVILNINWTKIINDEVLNISHR
jgi:hypothetical protein